MRTLVIDPICITVSGVSGAALSNYIVVKNAATLTVTSNVSVQFDQSKAHQSGSVIPIKLDLLGLNGANVGSAGTTLTALRVVGPAPAATARPVQSPGNSQPGNLFKYSGGDYQFNLDTNGLTAGTYLLVFSISGDPLEHTVSFVIR